MALTYEDKMTTAGSQYAALNNKALAPRQAPDFTAPIEQAWEEVRTLQARLDSLADRLCGSVANCREALDRIERALP